MPLVKEQPGPRFNRKMLSYQYRKSHCGDETVVRPSYLHNGIFFYTGKTTSLYWIRAQAAPWPEAWGLKGFISYSLFADVDTGIYPHAAWQYHARLKAKRGIAMLSVDKFPYPRKQTRSNEFIPCSNNICDILKRFRSFKIPAITLIWPKSSYKHNVTRSYLSGKESGRRTAVGIAIVTSSMTFFCLYISRWWRQTWDTAPYFMVVNQSEARISTEHGIKGYITDMSIYTTVWVYGTWIERY